MPVNNPADPATWVLDVNGKVWTPTRSGSVRNRALYQLTQELQRDRRRGPRVVDKTSGAAVVTPAGLPRQIISCSATESPSAQVDRTFSQVTVSFRRDPSDQNYAGVHIWFTGYKGNTQPVLMTDAQDSPAVFLCETTKENITVTVQPFNGGHVAAPFAGAKACSVALDGVVSAPAAPSLTSATATITSGAVTVGQQFSFNFLPPSLNDVVLGYWIYRVSSHVAPTPPASRVHFVLHNPNQQGAFTYADPSGVSTNFYYVSAVNKSGLESTLTDCASAAVNTTYRPTTATAAVGGGFSNPSNVWDGNTTTYSSASSPYGGNNIEETWQGFANATGTNTTTLYISVAGSGGCVLSYSINGGSSFTNLTVPSSQTTVSVSIPVATNLSSIVVKGRTNPPGTRTGAVGALKIYEIWVQTT